MTVKEARESEERFNKSFPKKKDSLVTSLLRKASPKRSLEEEMKFRKSLSQAYKKGYKSARISKARREGKMAAGWSPTKKGRGRPKNIENIPSNELERRIEALEERKELESKFATLSGREIEKPVRKGISADVSTWFGNGEKKKKRLTIW